MNNRYIIGALFILLIGGVCGFAIKEWTTPEPPTVTAVQQTQQHAVSDSAGKARVYAEGYEAGKASVKPEIRTITVAGQTHTEVVYDSASLSWALQAYAVLDSVLGVHEALKDIVAHDLVQFPGHVLDLTYRLRERSFRGSTVTCTRPDSIRTVEVPRAETWWDHWSLGATLGASTIYVPREGVRVGPGITIGLHYAF